MSRDEELETREHAFHSVRDRDKDPMECLDEWERGPAWGEGGGEGTINKALFGVDLFPPSPHDFWLVGCSAKHVVSQLGYPE